MDVTLVTEGTYPFHLGGVSVWCDQLVRDMEEHRFSVLALTSNGLEPPVWGLPPNVTHVREVPLWARLPHSRAVPSRPAEFLPALGRFFESLAIENGGAGFVESLKELAQLAQARQLSPAMSSVEAVDQLLSMAPRCSERVTPEKADQLSAADAVDVLVLFEHFLRPLSLLPPLGDICHSVANGLGTLPALAAKWAYGTPFLLTEHGLYLRERYLSYKPGSLNQPARAIVLRFFRLVVETAYQAADIVAPGSGYNRLWEVANGTPSGRIWPVHNGIDPALFPVAKVEPEVPTLAWIGRIDPLKDLETLLRGFALVRVAIPGCRLRIFGPTPEGGGEYLRRCVDLAAELGLTGSAIFEGRVTSPIEAYHAGHVVVLTSISEGLPYTVLEAMACGRPVVATDVGGVAEEIGDTGILVPPRSPSEFASACVRLLSDVSLRHALGAAARDRVLSFFTAKASFESYRRIYLRLGARSSSDVVRLPPRGPRRTAQRPRGPRVPEVREVTA